MCRAIALVVLMTAVETLATDTEPEKLDSTVRIDPGLVNILFTQTSVYNARFARQYACEPAKLSSPNKEVAAFFHATCREQQEREVKARELTERAVTERSPLNACERQFIEYASRKMVMDANRKAAQKLAGSRGAAPIAAQHEADAASLEKAEQEGEVKFRQMGCRCTQRKDNGAVAEASCEPLKARP